MGYFERFAARMSEPVEHVQTFARRNYYDGAGLEKLQQIAYGGTLPSDVGSEEAAWRFYDTIPELHFGVNTTANVIARMDYKVFERTADGLKLVRDPLILAPVVQLFDGGIATAVTTSGELVPLQRMGQGPLIRTMALNWMVPGRMFLVQLAGIWNVYSVDQISINPGKPDGTGATVSLETVGGSKTFHGHDVKIRPLTRPHPKNPALSDSPVRSLGTTLDTITVLTNVIRSAGYSRLFWGSILHVSDKFRTPRLGAAAAVQYGNDYLLYALNEKMKESSDGTKVPAPILLSGPDSADIKKIRVYDDLPADAEQLMRLMWQRVAVGLDVPAELLTGENMSSHLSRWQVEEAIVNLHGQTSGQDLATGLKLLILDEAWANMGLEPSRFVLKVDAAGLTQRPLSNLEKLNLFASLAELTGMTLPAEALMNEFGVYPEILVPALSATAPTATGRNRMSSPDVEDGAMERGMPDDVSGPTRRLAERL